MIFATDSFTIRFIELIPVADPGKNLTGDLHSNFGRCGCGGRA